MSETKNPIKKLWRKILGVYYRFERSVLRDQVKKERFLKTLSLLPVQKNKVVMDNFGGRGFGENPRYIAEELLRRPDKYKIIWLVNDLKDVFPKGVTPVYRQSLRALYECVTAKVCIFNRRNGKIALKRKNQVYLQTWHAGLSLKKIEKDAEDKLSPVYVKDAKEDGRLADGIIVDGKINDDIMRSSFWLNENCELLRFGSPRQDPIINEKQNKELMQAVRKRLGIKEQSFFVLYAPTFRNGNRTDGYINNIPAVIQALTKRFGETTFVIRFHPNVANSVYSKVQGITGVINASYYPDPQELVIAADCVISDYSSIAYDFALLGKPVFLCTKDVDQYIEERGVYDVFYDQPFTLNYSEEQLINEITYCSLDEQRDNVATFFVKYPTYNEGTASQQTVDWLINKGLRKHRWQ